MKITSDLNASEYSLQVTGTAQCAYTNSDSFDGYGDILFPIENTVYLSPFQLGSGWEYRATGGQSGGPVWAAVSNGSSGNHSLVLHTWSNVDFNGDFQIKSPQGINLQVFSNGPYGPFSIPTDWAAMSTIQTLDGFIPFPGAASTTLIAQDPGSIPAGTDILYISDGVLNNSSYVARGCIRAQSFGAGTATIIKEVECLGDGVWSFYLKANSTVALKTYIDGVEVTTFNDTASSWTLIQGGLPTRGKHELKIIITYTDAVYAKIDNWTVTNALHRNEALIEGVGILT